MSLKYGLLGLLSYEPTTGYDIAKKFNGTLSLFWQATASQVYRELDAMEQNGWLVSEHVIQNDKPNKRVYSVTEEGHTELTTWLSMPSLQNAMQAKSEFLMRLFFAGETNKEQAIHLLRLYQQECEDNIYNIENAQKTQLLRLYQRTQLRRLHEQGRVKYPVDLEDIQNLMDEHDTEDISHQRTLFWQLTASHGKVLSEAAIKWAEDAIKLLENEK